ncbi:hypothetical protein N307_14707, partial [Dryobates pubescens]
FICNNSCQQYTWRSVKEVPESERHKSKTTRNCSNSSSIPAHNAP